MLSTQALRDQLNRYADGALSTDALEEWLASESWNMRQSAPIGVQRLVESIQTAFISFSDGKISDLELDRFLKARGEQLHRAAEATVPFEKALRDAIAKIKVIENQTESITFGFALATVGG